VYRRPALIIAGIITAIVAVLAIILLARFYFTTVPVATPAVASPGASFATSPTPSGSVYPAPIPGATETWPTQPHVKVFAGVVPPNPVLTAVRVGSHDTYDRIAFDFKQDRAPGYTVQYVTQAARSGSGQVITVPGSAILEVAFVPADAHDSSGHVASGAPTTPQPTGFSGLQSYVMSGDFEGHVTFDLGTAGQTGFHVQELRSGDHWTVYVDVRH
jgi:hypothetical protein